MIEPTFCGSLFSTGRLLAIEDYHYLYYSVLGKDSATTPSGGASWSVLAMSLVCFVFVFG